MGTSRSSKNWFSSENDPDLGRPPGTFTFAHLFFAAYLFAMALLGYRVNGLDAYISFILAMAILSTTLTFAWQLFLAWNTIPLSAAFTNAFWMVGGILVFSAAAGPTLNLLILHRHHSEYEAAMLGTMLLMPFNGLGLWMVMKGLR